MPEPTCPSLSLAEYKIISFDVYGTLIQYKSRILEAFRPLISQLPASSKYLESTSLDPNVPDCATVGDVEFLKLFQKTEDMIKLELADSPMRFDAVLQEIYRRIATALELDVRSGEAESFGSIETIQSWPVFDGTVLALQRLQDLGYQLVALSNIDKWATEITFDSTGLKKLSWAKLFTAEDFGTDAEALKNADIRKLQALIDFSTQNGVGEQHILHVAQSLGHDHKPAKDLSIASVFLTGDGPIWGKEAESKMAVEKELVGYGWRCRNLREFVTVVEKERS